MENPIKMDDLGIHCFWKHPYPHAENHMAKMLILDHAIWKILV